MPPLSKNSLIVSVNFPIAFFYIYVLYFFFLSFQIALPKFELYQLTERDSATTLYSFFFQKKHWGDREVVKETIS